MKFIFKVSFSSQYLETREFFTQDYTGVVKFLDEASHSDVQENRLLPMDAELLRELFLESWIEPENIQHGWCSTGIRRTGTDRYWVNIEVIKLWS